MIETETWAPLEKDDVDKIIDLCRDIKDENIRKIILGTNYSNYERELELFEDNLRRAPLYRAAVFSRLINLAFAYVASKCATIGLCSDSNCEARIKHAIENLYNSYNVTDDVVQFVILNVALGLDASDEFLHRFKAISHRQDFYSQTGEYIDIFKVFQEFRQSSFKSKGQIRDWAKHLYAFFKKVSFLCDIEIVTMNEYVDSDSKIVPCGFKFDSNIYSSKYMLAKHSVNEYNDNFLFLRSIDESVDKAGKKILILSYTDIGENDTSETSKVIVYDGEKRKNDKDIVIQTKSLGKFYSYITGDLLRKRHRMSFCNGLSSYKYYGELATSVMDALEIMVRVDDKRRYVVENYILPVISNNFDTCKEDCICSGAGCKYDANDRQCNRDKIIDAKDKLRAHCVSNMDIVSILTILFSVVGCKDILPQIFAKFEFGPTQTYDELFSKVNEQLSKRFSQFNTEEVENRRKKFYKASIDYLSLNLDDSNKYDKVVAQTLKPFKIRAYTDALVVSLENLDSGYKELGANPSENVYSIQNKIDLINGLSTIFDVRSALKDTLKIILAYYAGLASCTEQQLDYEIKAERAAALDSETIEECKVAIESAFYAGVKRKLEQISQNDSFYSLFKMLVDDNNEHKSQISIMLGREIVNTGVMKRYIRLDSANKKCFLVEERRDGFYQCDLDVESQCREDREKFVERVSALLMFLKGEESYGARFSCYPQVLTHTSSRTNVDKTTIGAFTVYENEQYIPQKEYNVISYFSYEIGKRYYYIAPKKFEKTRWITYPILVRCSIFYKAVLKEGSNG